MKRTTGDTHPTVPTLEGLLGKAQSAMGEHAQALQTHQASLEQKINSATPMGPHGQPEDVSPLAVYLASDDSSFVTGQAWNVDGGILMAT